MSALGDSGCTAFGSIQVRWVRLIQEEVEAHPDWARFGDQAAQHPPLRGWLATAVCGEDKRNYGLLQLSDKSGGANFTAEDADRIREPAAFAGATLDDVASWAALKQDTTAGVRRERAEAVG